MPSSPTSLDGFSRALLGFVRGVGPLFLIIVAFMIGAAALYLTPREEEPQIVVPLADVFVRAPGLDARQVERQVATPLEKLLFQIDGVEYVYSMSRPGEAIVTVRFYVGEDREDSLVKIYNKIDSNLDLVPESVQSWVVKPIEVDDVPIVIASLYSSQPEKTGDHELRRLAEEVALRLQAVSNTNRITIHGGRPREFAVELNPEALAARDTAALDLLYALDVSNTLRVAGSIERNDEALVIEAGDFIRSAEDLENMVVNVVDGIPVFLRDVATVIDGPAEPDTYTWLAFGAADDLGPQRTEYPMVSIAVAKRKGSNAVWVAQDILAELDALRDEIFPADVDYRIIRNYGRTANEKVNNLVSSLLVAVLSVVIFIGAVMGWRPALVVGLAVPITYGFTLGVNLISGYTINRVTLFALILALGLLVDDPITGVDNIDRFGKMGRFPKWAGIAAAMQEVRSALIMSTIAIILSFVPLSFITGMMGPYMAPMAVNVPLAVTFSTVVAFLITPWMAGILLRPKAHDEGWDVRRTPLYRIYNTTLRPLVSGPGRAWVFVAAIGGLFLFSVILPAFRVVPLKLLPFDNKDEFQVVIDMPEGTTLERTAAAASALTRELLRVAEVKEVAAFVGVPSPMDFNGLVRHYFLREASHVADLRVTLAPRLNRSQQSHGLLLRVRDDLERVADEVGANIKLVEVPPGPPVISAITVELYGERTTTYQELVAAADPLIERLAQEPLVVDIDSSVEARQTKVVYTVDQEKAALSGIPRQDILHTLDMATDGMVAGYAEIPTETSPLPIVFRLPPEETGALRAFDSIHLKGQQGFGATSNEDGTLEEAPQAMVPLGELVRPVRETVDQTIYHKNLKPVVYIYADTAGRAPADVIQDVVWDQDLEQSRDEPRTLAERTYATPGSGIAWSLPEGVRAVWHGEGEWEVTIRVFRDLGIAFAAALVGIFVVLVIQTGSVPISLIIMLAIPLSMIGIMPGFWLLNLVGADPVAGYPNPSFFTATAMIGMIALAGIVVRNSLILVEFIHSSLAEGTDLEEALIQAGAIRMRPVILTAGTTLLGNIVITLDPIFNGLAWAVIFGISASTVFTLGVIPVVYYLVYRNHPRHGLPAPRSEEE